MAGEHNLRVLIVRLGAMGDVLHALPAVTALRLAHPEWFLGWAIEPRWQALLRAEDGAGQRGPGRPLVDRVHLANARGWARRPLHSSTLGNIREVRRELREARYDVCVDLQGALRSAVIGRWSRAQRVIGEAAPREAAARWLFREQVSTRRRHVIEQAIEVLEAISREELPTLRPLLPLHEGAQSWVGSLLKSRLQSPFILINPGAGWGAKRWPIDRYGRVALELTELGYGVIVNTGPEELQLGRELVAMTKGAAVAVSPDLGELMELMRCCSLAIAGDTGPLHLACALGKPVVAIFGPTDPARNGPFGCDFRVLRHPGSKRDHSRHSQPEAGLLTITPQAVVAAAKDLLSAAQC